MEAIEQTMLDFFYLAVTCLFFAISIAMVKGLDRLLGVEGDE